MRIHRFWFLKTLGLTLLAVSVVILFNFLVDPYGLYGVLSIPGVNANKHVATRHSRMIKPYLVERGRYQALALGSSRTEIGIDPDHPGWDPLYRPSYNLALGGAGIEEIAGRFESVLEKQSVSQVVVGLDFFMFNALLDNPLSRDRGVATFQPDDFGDLVLTLGTVDAFLDSLETLRKQDKIKNPAYRQSGQIDLTFNIARLQRGGHHKSFLRMERKYLESNFFPPPGRIFRFVHPDTGESTFLALRRVLDLARENRVDLRLFISPCHSRMMEVIEQAGLWPLYEEWKRELVRLLDEEALAHPGKNPYVLWDFSGFNSVTMEEVPPPGDIESRMRYYWEGSHYRSETGDLVLDRLFGVSDANRPIPEDFGAVLTSAGIEEHLAETRRRKEIWRRSHASEVDEIHGLAREALSASGDPQGDDGKGS